MPWDVRKQGQKYAVVKQGTGEVVAVHDTRAAAEAQVRALYANTSKERDTPGTMAGGKVPSALDDTYTARPITHAYMDGKKYRLGGKVGLPATGDGQTEKGLGAGIPVTDSRETSNTNARARKRPNPAADPDDNPTTGTFKLGGKLKSLVKKTTKPIRDAANEIDDTVFGGEGIMSNIRKLRKELNSGKRKK